MSVELAFARGEEATDLSLSDVEDFLFGEAGGHRLSAFKTLLLCHKLLQQGKNDAHRGLKFSCLVPNNSTQQTELAATYHLFCEAQEVINVIVQKMNNTTLGNDADEEGGE